MLPAVEAVPSSQRQIDNEVPLSLALKLREEEPVSSALLATVAIRDGRFGRRTRQMVSTILANVVTNLGQAVFYSRDHNVYSTPAARRYFPEYYTYAATRDAVTALCHEGLVQEIRTPASPRATKRSMLRAAAPLVELLGRLGDVSIEHVENEPIVLKQTAESRTQIDYAETDETRAMRADVRAQNAFLGGYIIGIDGDSPANRRWDPDAKLFHRVFNGDFQHGGRWYGPIWQGLTKLERSRLTLDGAPTCELDFQCCQPRLLCAYAGVTLPFEDASFDFYQLPGFARTEVKLAFNILLNARSLRQARGALADALRARDVLDAQSRASVLLQRLKAAWPGLAPWWHTGLGLRLQRVDADICMTIQAELRRLSIPVLSIHDSFIVRVGDRAVLQRVMDETMKEACLDLRRHPLRIRGHDARV